MRATATTIALMIAMFLLLSQPPAMAQEEAADLSEWWYVPYPKPFDASVLTSTPGLIRVEGNRFVDESGNPVILRGVNISDPDKLHSNGHWSKHHFEVIKQWGATAVRVPVHPVAWKSRGKDAYLKLLDQAVVWASDLGLYLIIEWHAIGNLKTELFQHPMHETTRRETYAFWRAIAHRYKGISTVAFYELFNEPTIYLGQLGRISWLEWKEINEEIIQIIYAHDTEVIPLVGGFNWAYELRSVIDNPVDAEGIGYVTHPYPQKASEPLEASWERDFGHVAKSYPLFATELGFMAADDPGAHNPVVGGVDYGQRIIAYFEERGISWTAWCFDPDWPPQLISDWDYTPTTQGAFFREVMQARR
jgi:aryl-phospho-beta-D-glucosidase BglC (GH1 family)